MKNQIWKIKEKSKGKCIKINEKSIEKNEELHRKRLAKGL